MKKKLFLFCFMTSTIIAQKKDNFITFFEKGNGNQSATYSETIDFFKALDTSFETIYMKEMGLTDSGEPLHIVTFNADKNFNFEEIRETKSIILVNNAIHAGEPDGIDATMMLFRDLATSKVKIPENIVLVAIPVYNIGGALNRNSTSRANQNGPEEYGFRGNARNFDLNRDFIKSDTRNTKSFIEIFHLTQPILFIDNHVTNGADYQYTLTYIMTEPKKLGNELGSYLKDDFNVALVSDLKKKKTETTPYVSVWRGTPEDGFQQFFESPRYATGYTSLFDCLGYVVETHMLKDYKSRVKVTYDFMLSAIHITSEKAKTIQQKQLVNKNQFKAGNKYTLHWKIDTTKVTQLPFYGYESSKLKSKVTNGERLYYDRKRPFTKFIPFLGDYISAKEITIPSYYIIPKGQWTVIEQLKANKIEWMQLKNDTIIEVENYHISDYQTYKNVFEGHYVHYNTKVLSKRIKIPFKKGDYLISTKQKGVKFLLETLEPEAVDSYFNWNYFDTILQQKEGYSSYVFEDLANDYLNQNPTLREALEEKKKTDTKFAENPEEQLDWVYKNSPYYEKEHLRYPVYRISEK